MGEKVNEDIHPPHLVLRIATGLLSHVFVEVTASGLAEVKTRTRNSVSLFLMKVTFA